MGIFDIFRRDELNGAKVLVCGLAPQFHGLVTMDSEVYKRFYPSTVATLFCEIQELIAAVNRQYDIIHLLCDVLRDGTIQTSDGTRITGTELLQKCCDSNVKLLWVASDNESDRYINGFNARDKRINFIMTLHRNGSKFPEFLDRLLFRVHRGDTVPIAWSDLCPQIPGDSHSDSPSCIFWAGRGGVKLR